MSKAQFKSASSVRWPHHAPHERHPRPREDPAVDVEPDGLRCAGDGCLDAAWSGCGDEVEHADFGEVAGLVVEVDSKVSGGLLDVEEEQVAVGGHEGSVGVGDSDRFTGSDGLGSDVDGVGLGVLAGGAADRAGFAVDREALQLEGAGVAGADVPECWEEPGGGGASSD